MRNRFIKLSEDFHHPIHLMIGLIVGLVFFLANDNLELDKVLFYAGLGSLVPDVDHFFFLFIYGRSTDYAKATKGFIRSRELGKLFNFLKSNHKNNTRIYTHNIFTIIVIYILAVSAKNNDHIYLTVFLLACISHYLFDIVEDIIYFGNINSNWYLKFGRIQKSRTKDK